MLIDSINIKLIKAFGIAQDIVQIYNHINIKLFGKNLIEIIEKSC